MDKVQEKIKKWRAKHKRLELQVKSRGQGDKQNHLSFIERILQQKQLKDQLTKAQHSPKYLN
jgi:hypothetical protein